MVSLMFFGFMSCLVLAWADSGYSTGRHFVAAFMYNYGSGKINDTANYLFITSKENGTVFVEMSQVDHTPGWSHRESITSGQMVRVALPEQSEFGRQSVLEKRGVHVYSNVDISVYAMNDDTSMTSADAAVVLPVTSLSTRYVVPTPSSNPVILVAGLIPGTSVNIQMNGACTITYKGKKYTGKVNITDVLDNQDVIQLLPTFSPTSAGKCDLSGTIVTASHPVGVFSGSACAYQDRTAGCGFEMQQVIPDELVGTRFIIPDLMDNKNYVVRIVATSLTTIYIDEYYKDGTAHRYQMDVDEGEMMEFSLPDGAMVEIFSHNGIHVTQYDGSSAPFSNPIPATNSYGWNYTISTMNNPTSPNFANFVNIVARNPYRVRIDGNRVDQTKWRRASDLGYSVGTFPISPGSHHVEADSPFMVQVYGYDGAASYCYQAGYYFNTLPSAHLGNTDYPPTHGPTTPPGPTGSTGSAAPCEDSPGVNCQVLDSTIFVCSNPSSANSLCRKTCNLCQACPNPAACVVG